MPLVITNEEAVKVVESYAEQRGLSKAEAGAKLIFVARSRLNATNKYAAKAVKGAHPKKKDKPGKAKAAGTPKKAAKVKAPKGFKTVKAKAPVVRKPKVAAAEVAPAEVATA